MPAATAPTATRLTARHVSSTRDGIRMRAPTPSSLASPCHVGGQASPTAFGGEVEEAPESGLQVWSGPLARPRPGETRVPRGKDQLEVVWGRYRDSHRTWILWTATEEHSTESPASWTAAHAGSWVRPVRASRRRDGPRRAGLAITARGGQVPGVIMYPTMAASTPRAPSGQPARGLASPSPWAGPGRPSATTARVADGLSAILLHLRLAGADSLRWDGLVVPAARRRGRAHAVSR
jgi:hypothetical protein